VITLILLILYVPDQNEYTFSGNYVYYGVQGSYLPHGYIIVVFENSSFYEIEYMYGPGWVDANDTYGNLLEDEIASLFEYINFHSNYSVLNSNKGVISNDTLMADLFSNETQRDGFINLNDSYQPDIWVTDHNTHFIGIKYNETDKHVSYYMYTNDGTLPIFDWYYSRLLSLKTLE